MRLLPNLFAISILLACGAACAEVRIAPQESGVKVRLRGISAVSTDIAWASGREGTVLRTIDGGKHWTTIKVPAADMLDFRDVEGFDADNAVVLSIGTGEASRVYRTHDSGKSWTLALQNRDPRAFFDCMAFEGQRGWMLGDPVDGYFQIYATDDQGRTWRLLPDGPRAETGEAAFAASGSCIAKVQDALIIGTGGSRARFHRLGNGNPRWQTFESGMARGKSEAGVFSLTPAASGVFAVGGDYAAERSPGNATEWRDATKRNSLIRLIAPRGYRSGVACHDGTPLACVAVGPTGVDLWNTVQWATLSGVGYDAIDLAGTVGWASGDAGRIARIEIKE
ncbi:MAG: hypothetical protein ABIO38_04815 [Luteimonas sp.]